MWLGSLASTSLTTNGAPSNELLPKNSGLSTDFNVEVRDIFGGGHRHGTATLQRGYEDDQQERLAIGVPLVDPPSAQHGNHICITPKTAFAMFNGSYSDVRSGGNSDTKTMTMRTSCLTDPMLFDTRLTKL